jgi:hypothetical protein
MPPEVCEAAKSIPAWTFCSMSACHPIVSIRGRNRFLLELFCMLLRLVGLPGRVLNSQVTGAKPVQVHKRVQKIAVLLARLSY